MFGLFPLVKQKHLELQSSNHKPSLLIIPFDIVAHAFTLLKDDLSQNSCVKVHVNTSTCTIS